MLRRIFTIVAILAAIGVVVLTQTMVRDRIQKIMDERKANADERDKQRRRATTAEAVLSTTSNNLVRTSATLTTTTADLEKTRGELANMTSANEKALADLKKSQEAVRSADQRLEQWRALGMSPEAVKELQASFGRTNLAYAASLDENKVILRAYTKATNELRSLLTGETYEAPLPVGLKGMVVAVDPKWDFVVLNIGDKNGVLKDGVMKVHRDSKLVGKVKITNVMVDRSIANVIPGWKLDEIREKDEVLY